jgi:anti-sigma regulatory factor (Ser/Thr protein kinase)
MRLRIFPTLQAPSEARRVLSPIGELVDEASLADLRSVVSELIGISVASGASKPIDLSLELVDGEIEGVVDDHGPGTRAMMRAREHRDDSFVLRIIDGLVVEWNASRRGIWFRMAVRPLG